MLKAEVLTKGREVASFIVEFDTPQLVARQFIYKLWSCSWLVIGVKKQ